MTVLTVVGARPQFVKAFPVSQHLRERHREVLVHTGQHYDNELSDVFFEELPIPEVDHNLRVGSGQRGRQTARMLLRLDPIVERVEPDAILVYGDTNSTLAGALAAVSADCPLVHVEAGLRSGDRSMPEETNRILTDHAAAALCAPNEAARETLAAEGITEGVAVTGDVMYDALLAVRGRAAERSSVLERLGLSSGEYVLATVHRAANTDDRARLAAVMDGLAAAPLPVVLPLHPRTERALRRYSLYEEYAERLQLVDPQGYLDFVRLLDEADRVATDSGGVQKEACYLRTRCITMRDTTEWPETVEAGLNELVGADTGRIERALRREDPLPEVPDLYGGGRAAERVVEVIDDVVR